MLNAAFWSLITLSIFFNQLCLCSLIHTAMVAVSSYLCVYLLLAIAFSSFSAFNQADVDCVYTIYIRTGSIPKGGTDSIISATFSNIYNETVQMGDLEIWGGLMGIGYNYFERGNLDIFSGKGKCLSAPICALNLTSDGSSPHHGWYVNYVEVTSAGVHSACSQTQFKVEQWLATDTSPYQLTALTNYCSTSSNEPHTLSASMALSS